MKGFFSFFFFVWYNSTATIWQDVVLPQVRIHSSRLREINCTVTSYNHLSKVSFLIQILIKRRYRKNWDQHNHADPLQQKIPDNQGLSTFFPTRFPIHLEEVQLSHLLAQREGKHHETSGTLIKEPSRCSWWDALLRGSASDSTRRSGSIAEDSKQHGTQRLTTGRFFTLLEQ